MSESNEKVSFVIGETITVIDNQYLKGNDYGPNLKLEEEYPVKDIWVDSEGNQHLDVGLVSDLAFIRSYETKEHIPNGDKIHWCHPSRFKK